MLPHGIIKYEESMTIYNFVKNPSKAVPPETYITGQKVGGLATF